MTNPVFVNEMRQSLFRRKPIVAFGIWGGATAFLMWASQFVEVTSQPLSWLPAFVLPIIVPPFAAGLFAKEYEQQTWQDLYLTRLTNAEVVFGKFCAALCSVGLIVLSFIPAIVLMMIYEGHWLSFAPGLWMITLLGKLILSASLYVLLAMVCSRYSSNRRTALVWSYIALFLYALLGAAVWSLVGQEVARSDAYDSGYGYSSPPTSDPVAPGFMQGIHLIFCGVVGLGAFVLLWVSMSEQRGYRSDGLESKRSWQPIGRRERST